MVSMIIAADYNRPWNLGDGGSPLFACVNMGERLAENLRVVHYERGSISDLKLIQYCVT